MSNIKEFWIVRKEGIPIFSYSPNDELNSNLIGSFFSAIQTFASNLSSDSKDNFVSSISLGNSVFNFLINKRFEIFFILKSEDKISQKMAQKHLREIETIFLEEFREELESFDGDVTLFKTFKSRFEDYFKDNFTKLKGLW
ncbi:MAG: hypothetical protein BAJALOKI2v1_150009 [Promethearchaeota archaeon]|nr:MAG: hypothetical protein BAJALOKI2v1_150009 [Candidatus Lokiarchaeota archaeon]